MHTDGSRETRVGRTVRGAGFWVQQVKAPATTLPLALAGPLIRPNIRDPSTVKRVIRLRIERGLDGDKLHTAEPVCRRQDPRSIGAKGRNWEGP